jgi:hypothetical protein
MGCLLAIKTPRLGLVRAEKTLACHNKTPAEIWFPFSSAMRQWPALRSDMKTKGSEGLPLIIWDFRKGSDSTAPMAWQARLQFLQ